MRPMRPVAFAAVLAVLGAAPAAWADVALMAGQRATPLRGEFNSVPVLHSNQPEQVTGPGILVSTTGGQARAENGQMLRHATYTFNGDFGIHAHHKYYPSDASRLGGARQRGTLTIATIAINNGDAPVTLEMSQGSVKNSFEAPYKVDGLMGVKVQGYRPWNAGPGDATSVQMLRGKLDRKLPEQITIPARSRIILFSTNLPARGIANALLKGTSSGPFQMAVVAAEDPKSDADLFAVLDGQQLAGGRIYLDKVAKINNGEVFSRVGGVAIGDAYSAAISHDLRTSPLHVPFTTTSRHHFGTGENQVNRLATRMRDSSLDNVGTYGVRYDVDLNLIGSGNHRLMLSHPSIAGRQFTAFRGTIAITDDQETEELHVGMRSGQSLELKALQLREGQPRNLRISMVYPADATPGHLLSVVPEQQLLALRQKQTMMQVAQQPAQPALMPVAPPPPIPQQQRLGAGAVLQKTAPRLLPYGGWPNPAPAMLDPARPYQLMRHWLNR